MTVPKQIKTEISTNIQVQTNATTTKYLLYAKMQYFCFYFLIMTFTSLKKNEKEKKYARHT